MTNGKERPAKRGLCGEAQAVGLTKPPQLRLGSSLTWPALTPRMERPHTSHTKPRYGIYDTQPHMYGSTNVSIGTEKHRRRSASDQYTAPD